MKITHRLYTYWCRRCGRRAQGWDARVPEGCDPEKCGPYTCGHCKAIGRFRAEPAKEAA